MTKQWKPDKQSVDLGSARPSRIRREPPRPDTKLETLAGKVDWGSREWEIRFALAGMIFFALAICAVVIDIGEVLSHQ